MRGLRKQMAIKCESGNKCLPLNGITSNESSKILYCGRYYHLLPTTTIVIYWGLIFSSKADTYLFCLPAVNRSWCRSSRSTTSTVTGTSRWQRRPTSCKVLRSTSRHHASLFCSRALTATATDVSTLKSSPGFTLRLKRRKTRSASAVKCLAKLYSALCNKICLFVVHNFVTLLICYHDYGKRPPLSSWNCPTSLAMVAWLLGWYHYIWPNLDGVVFNLAPSIVILPRFVCLPVCLSEELLKTLFSWNFWNG